MAARLRRAENFTEGKKEAAGLHSKNASALIKSENQKFK